jgi:hypothetical protein
MRPYLEDSPLEWRGHSGIVIFPVVDLSGQTEVMGFRPEFDESRFHTRMRLHGRCGLLGCSRSGMGDGRFFSSPASRKNQTSYG